MKFFEACNVYKKVTYDGPGVIKDIDEINEVVSPKDYDYIDVGPNAELPPGGLHTLLIRPEYREMIQTIRDSPKHFAILGGPGIGLLQLICSFPEILTYKGKTCALSVILVEKLIRKLPTTYHPDDKDVYLFTKDGFQILDSGDHDAVYGDEAAWHLGDSNHLLISIPSVLGKVRGKIIQAAFPKKKQYAEWLKQMKGWMWWMSPPTWQEVYVSVFVAIHFI
jgi:hypothetical protein